MDGTANSMNAMKLGDDIDARSFFGGSKSSIVGDAENIITSSAGATVYSMKYPKRGRCLIFNHREFKSSTGLNTRNGTDADASRLYIRFKDLKFDVAMHSNLTVKQVLKELEKASKEDHSQNSCFVVCILSHGEQGVLYGADGKYSTDSIFTMFRGDVCPSLAGKPKMFFIQACQGDGLDGGVGVTCRESADSESEKISSFRIPICADFLIAYSTVSGFYSWRNTSQGSWFIQALCQVLQEYATEMDLLSMLTIVNYRVAYHFESYVPQDPSMHLKKQVPSINTTLTRMIKFT